MPINGNVSTVAAALAAMASRFGIGGVFIKLGQIAMRNDLLQQKVEMKTEIKKELDGMITEINGMKTELTGFGKKTLQQK